ncbi:MAG: 3-dehydroquinate synthase [Flavobacteriales bacterium]|nr:3-dehydroquinate synthase [Flavobacteriales bacterium]
MFHSPRSTQEFNAILEQLLQGKSKAIVLVDSNTLEHCWPRIGGLPALKDVYILEVSPGEDSKDLDICQGLWAECLSHGMDRNSVLINLGGGVVTDLGGFVASTFQRGIDFIHIPTTNLAMVDAAIGGKTGVNFNHLKNQIGTFAEPIAVILWPAFLDTLPQEQLESGFAEVLKHALIADPELFRQLRDSKLTLLELFPQIMDSACRVKTSIVARDHAERDERKKLNFGHTIGHALETVAWSMEQPVTHGVAVAAGMIAAVYLSFDKCGLAAAEGEAILEAIRQMIDLSSLPHLADADVLKAMQYDKKNEGGAFRFVLLRGIGEAEINCDVSEAEAQSALAQMYAYLNA